MISLARPGSWEGAACVLMVFTAQTSTSHTVHLHPSLHPRGVMGKTVTAAVVGLEIDPTALTPHPPTQTKVVYLICTTLRTQANIFESGNFTQNMTF